MNAFILIAVVVLILGIFMGVFLHRRGMSFTGTVTDKDIHEQPVDNHGQAPSFNSNNVQHTYVVKIQTDAGKSINWNVSQGKYELLKIGDRVGKKPGTTDLEITPQVTTPPPAQPPTAQPPTPTA